LIHPDFLQIQAIKVLITIISVIPIKKKKGVPRTAKTKAHNKALSKRRILIENINRICEIFR